jgi:hypothetical protein
MAEETKKTESAPKDVMGFLEYYLVTKAPFQIPDNAKEWIVKYGPWITVVLLALALPGLLIIFGIGAALTPFAGYAYGTGFGLAAIVLIVQLGLELAALPGLFARKMMGWTLLFYSQIISLVYGLLNGNIFGALISALVGFYLLFQIRSKYSK